MFFDIGNASFGNIYGQYGTDNLSRSARESFFDKIDTSNYPEAKLSPTFKCLMQVFDLKDSYRLLHPAVQQFSRYYSLGRGVGATRIDRCYHYGNIIINYAVYHPLAFSDHHAHIVNITYMSPLAVSLALEEVISLELMLKLSKTSVSKISYQKQ